MEQRPDGPGRTGWWSRATGLFRRSDGTMSWALVALTVVAAAVGTYGGSASGYVAAVDGTVSPVAVDGAPFLGAPSDGQFLLTAVSLRPASHAEVLVRRATGTDGSLSRSPNELTGPDGHPDSAPATDGGGGDGDGVPATSFGYAPGQSLDRSMDNAWLAAAARAGTRIDTRAVLHVTTIDAGGVLAGRGVRAGDTVIAADGDLDGGITHVTLARAAQRPGSFELQVWRSGLIFSVTVPAWANQVSSEALGADLAAGTAVGGHRPNVTIDGDVSGPSGGLMLALGYLDARTIGDLTADLSVAGSGTITAAGHVGGVAALDWKARAAEQAGAAVFFAPEHLAGSVAAAVPGLRVVGVATLGDAVTWLCEHGATASVCTPGD